VDPARRLLELQAIDLEIDRLTARHRTLETGSELATARSEADAAETELGEQKLKLAALDRDGSRLEHEIDSLRQRSSAEERRLYDGSIANAKELGSLQREIENLGRRISDREDELLALLEQREQLEALAASAEATAGQLRDRAREVESASADEITKLQSELGERRAERAAIAPEVDPELLELYDDL
jgi:uncharacterized protein